MKHTIIATAMLLVAGLSACTNKQQGEEAHAHEDVSIQLTSYGKDFEVFAEADPFVVGKDGSILAHFSYLSNFKPLLKGKVTVSLIIGSKGIRQTLDMPERPGIYRFSLKPEVAGKGRLLFEVENGSGKSIVIADSITVFADEHDAIHEAEKGTKGRTNTTVFTKEQSWKIDFATALPSSEPFGQVIKATALVQPAQGNELVVTAKANGTVVFNSGAVLEGSNVSAGQALCTVTGSSFADNNIAVKYAESKSNYEKANADYLRAKELAKDRIVSEKELVSVKNQYENTKAVFDNLRKNFNATGQTITSPLAGFIKQVFVKNGSYVEAGQAVAVVSQNRSLVLAAEVPLKYASVLANIKTANIRATNENRSYSLEELKGKVLSYGKAANSDNYLIPVTLQVENNGSFISGSFVEVYLKTFTSNLALVVPNTALLEEQGSFFVWVQVTPELFEKREVFVGGTDGINSEIRRGVTANERVVTRGAMLIKLAQATGSLDAHSGHVH